MQALLTLSKVVERDYFNRSINLLTLDNVIKQLNKAFIST